MREILFRGKRVKNDEWLLGSLYQSPSSDKYSISGWEVVPETVGQYSGLEDKNGKKIFEGDILKIERDVDVVDKLKAYWINGVFWSDNELAFTLTKKLSGRGGLMLKIFLHKITHDLERTEVIGNIHDNPELLEVDNE